MDNQKKSWQPTGIPAFAIIWVGQLASLLGTGVSTFALTVWAFETTNSATALALVGFFYMVPMLALSPFAGTLVDRHSRKLMMIVSDAGAGIGTIVILTLYTMGVLEVWHLYISATIAGAAQTFQWPAYSATISTMLPKKHYGRVAGLDSLADSGSHIFSPILGAALYALAGLQIVLWLDIITFALAILALLIVYIPNPEKTAEGTESKGSFLQESMYGFRFIFSRPSLLGLQLVFMMGNFFATMAFTLVPAMILARTGNNALMLGSAQTAGAVGGILGGVLMGIWGGPKKLVYGVLGGWALSGLLGVLPLGLSENWFVWAGAMLMGAMFTPLINGSNQAIWQRKVAPDVQGRVFSIRRLIAWLVNPLALLLVGPWADVIMEPLMTSDTAVANLLGPIFGTTFGSGMAVIITFSGAMMVIIGLIGYTTPAVREVDERMADHEQPLPA
jgi:MFS transporter, DHA3 family, macrolide efflux protein